MVDQDTTGYNLSAEELRQLTDWPEALIEDYLNITGGVTQVVNNVNVELTEVTQQITALAQDIGGIAVNRARVTKLVRSIVNIQAGIAELEKKQEELADLIGNEQLAEDVAALLSNRQMALGRIRKVERAMPAIMSTRALIGI